MRTHLAVRNVSNCMSESADHLLRFAIKQNACIRHKLVEIVEIFEIAYENRAAEFAHVQIDHGVVQAFAFGTRRKCAELEQHPGQYSRRAQISASGAVRPCGGISRIVRRMAFSAGPVRGSAGWGRPKAWVNSERRTAEWLQARSRMKSSNAVGERLQRIDIDCGVGEDKCANRGRVIDPVEIPTHPSGERLMSALRPQPTERAFEIKAQHRGLSAPIPSGGRACTTVKWSIAVAMVDLTLFACDQTGSTTMISHNSNKISSACTTHCAL